MAQPQQMVQSPRQWLEAIDEYRQAFRPWTLLGRKIVDRYRLEKARAQAVSGSNQEQPARHNILWANVQTMKPALFSRSPIIRAERRHKDKDPLARLAGQVIERLLNVENESNGLQDTFDQVVLDVLLPGRGVPWVRFKTGEDGSRRAMVDYVHWTDFAHAPEKNWADIVRRGWVARRVSMSRREGRRRFGRVFNQVKLTLDRRTNDERPRNRRAEPKNPKFAEVWEIWDVESRSRLFVAEGVDKFLGQAKDPYEVSDFFPCPRPAYATLSNEDLEPTPDYQQYISQAEELDEISRRIKILTKALKMVGVYDRSANGIGTLLQSDDGKMIPVDNMTALIAKGQSTGGGLTGVVAFLPLRDIAEALDKLYQSRERIKQVLYEVSGISDIVRGQVDPREKAAQSKIKAEFASARLEQRRRAVERCARDTVRIVVEVALALYSSDELRLQSGFDMLQEVEALDPIARGERWTQVEQVLRDDKIRNYRVDVETDSTVQLKEEQEGQERTQFLQAAGTFINSALPVMQAAPDMIPVMGQLMLFAIRGFRAGRGLEASFTEAVEQMAQRAQQMQQDAAAQQGAEGQPPPDPAAEAEAQRVQQQGEIDAQQAQIATQKAQLELAMMQDEQRFKQQKYQLELEKLRMAAEAAAQPPVAAGPARVQ